ncbi:B12-binding domain-containing radical SAM protein, partial [Magnetococcales bacterium HHB-1]
LAEQSWEDVRGIAFIKNSEVIHTPPAEIIHDLNQYRNFDAKDYAGQKDRLLFRTKVDPDNLYFPVFATRGCPSNCIFCSLTADRVRFRDVDAVLDEIEAKIAITGVRNVSFGDSSLTLNKNYVTELCEKMLERDLRLRWNCYSRVDINPEILTLMAKAGLISVELAVESGSTNTLKTIKKGIKLQRYFKFIKKAHELGIRSWVFTMVSFPDETLEEAQATLKLIEASAPYIFDCGLQITRILPDTQLDGIARSRGVLPEDFSWFKEFSVSEEAVLLKTDDYQTIPIYRENLSVEELHKIMADYEQIKVRHFAYANEFWHILRNQLKLKNLTKLTPKRLINKIVKTAQWIPAIIRNREKQKSFS